MQHMLHCRFAQRAGQNQRRRSQRALIHRDRSDFGQNLTVKKSLLCVEEAYLRTATPLMAQAHRCPQQAVCGARGSAGKSQPAMCQKTPRAVLVVTWLHGRVHGTQSVVVRARMCPWRSCRGGTCARVGAPVPGPNTDNFAAQGISAWRTCDRSRMFRGVKCANFLCSCK